MRPLLLTFAMLAALAPATEAKLFDVNNDLRQDLVVGLPGWQTKDGQDVAAIYVRGAKRGLLGRASVLTHKELGVPEGGSNGMVGASVTSADFDGDDFEDLAFGAPFPGSIGGPIIENSGGVLVAYGSASFPPAARTAVLRQPGADSGLNYGDSVIAGDMNGENVDDLAIGPGELDLHFGKKEEGVTEPPDGTLAPPDGAPSEFGLVLAHGDVTDDGHAELFEAAPGVAVAFGREQGPQDFEWVDRQMSGGPTSLAIGDLDGDRYGDLVAGARDDGIGTTGAVKVWWGGPESLSNEPMKITQGSPGVPGSNEASDRFGASVAVGKLDNDRYADVVVGAPGENNQRGRVTIIRGGPTGYAREGSRSFGSSKRRDRDFGAAVGLLDFNGDDRLDLAVMGRRGVTVLRGTRRGISLKRPARLTFSAEGVAPGEGGKAPVLGRPGSSP